MTEPATGGRGLALMLAAVSAAAAFALPLWHALPLLLLADGLYLVAAALALGHAPAGGLAPTLGRRLPAVLLWLTLLAAAMAGLLLGPWLWLQAAGGLAAVLALSLALALGWLLLWRRWPLLGLALVDQPRRRGALALLRHCLLDSRRLVAADPSSSRGLLAALCLLALLLAGAALLALATALPLPWRVGLAALWTLLLAPGLAFIYLALVEPARLAAHREPLPAASPAPPRPAASAAAVVAERAPPTLLPSDPDARLWAAARIGRSDEALAALDGGADPLRLPEPDGRDQRTLAMLAAVLPDTRLLRRLIAAGVDLNHRQAGLTALLVATRDSLRGRPDTVMTLLANGADPRIADAEGRTPLHFAALAAEADVAALLLDAGAPIDSLNRDGYSPLGVACGQSNWRLARFLLDRRAKVEPAAGQPALLAAAGAEDDPVGVQLLLRHKAKVDSAGRLGRTPLMAAALAGNAQVVRSLLAAGADPNRRDEHGNSALLEAARAGANPVLLALREAGAAADAVDRSGRNALLLACQSPRADADSIRLLLAIGVDPAQPAQDGRNARDCALAAGRWPLLAVLDPSYPIPTSCADATPHALPAAVLADDGRPWQARVDEAWAEGEGWKLPALLRAAAVSVDEQAELLLRRAAELDRLQLRQLASGLPLSWFEQTDAPWRAALRRGDSALVELALEHGASVGGRGLLADFLAAKLAAGVVPTLADEALALELLSRGADAFGGQPAPLLSSLRLGWRRLLAALLQRGADPNSSDLRDGSALRLAVRCGEVSALARLLRHGARLQQRSVDGSSALGLALQGGQREAVEWLDWRGWQPPGRRLQADDLVAAAALGDLPAVQRLQAMGLPLEARDGAGASALMRASGGGHLEVVTWLLQQGADPGASAQSGATCLSAAVSRRHRSVVELLLSHGASVDQRLPGGATALMVAAALGYPEMLQLLLERGADRGASDQTGNQAIHALAQYGFSARDGERALACWQTLLTPADADLPGADGLSPLLLLLGARADSGHPIDESCLRAQVELLLQQPLDLDRRDSRGFGPLHLCALHGQLASLRRLLSAGADREARDTLNRRPHDIAVMRGFVDLASELEPRAPARPGEAPSLAGLLRRPGP